ncbi:unnamed protein product [Eruca vesicaria subsp. sativa]|uniref:BRX domain-containing protein n=1 Tax=Eruca vesicaria subsp. sativa TaxID=29727 RepID=A0ABC8JPW2_ERUVS|nr:unnamed protein product [Eruca vesicaria subsp. sativa]
MQIKDTAMKFSGAYKQCKPCTGSSGRPMKKGHRPFPNFDNASEGSQKMIGTDLDLTNSSHHPAGRSESKFTSVYGNDRESISAQFCDVLDDEGHTEWMAQVEPGVQITFALLPSGGNLQNIARLNVSSVRQALQTPARSDDHRDSTYSKIESARESKDWTRRHNFRPPRANVPHHLYGGSSNYGHHGEPTMDAAARTTTSSNDEPLSMSNASEMHGEWIEEDEPGVYTTIRQLSDGTRELPGNDLGKCTQRRGGIRTKREYKPNASSNREI